MSAGASVFADCSPADQAPILQNLDFSAVIDNPPPVFMLGFSLLLGGPSVKVESDQGENVEMYRKRVEEGVDGRRHVGL